MRKAELCDHSVTVFSNDPDIIPYAVETLFFLKQITFVQSKRRQMKHLLVLIYL